MLRIARTELSTFQLAHNQEVIFFSHYQRLVALIKKHLSPVTASVFARPILQDESEYVEWYSELQGQPVPLRSLPEGQQLKAKKLLYERLSSISKLADRLLQLEPDSSGFQTILQKSVEFPGDKAIYVINDQPVIIFWGISDSDNQFSPISTSYITDSKIPETTTSTKKTFFLFSFGLGLFFFVLLAGLFWVLLSKQPFNWKNNSPFENEYQLLLVEVSAAENNCSALKNIFTNNASINKTEEKFVLLKRQLKIKLTECEALIALRKEIESAQNDCPRLKNILINHPNLQNIESKFIATKQQLDIHLNNCNRKQLELLPQILDAFVPGLPTFIPETQESTLEKIKRIGIYLSGHKDAVVLITLHTPVEPGH
ncbi:MAG: hypothetical protein R3E36_11395, partial [Nitrosomonas sp.]|nr:hypothetical protein [Nitrosomonas sp.]